MRSEYGFTKQRLKPQRSFGKIRELADRFLPKIFVSLIKKIEYAIVTVFLQKIVGTIVLVFIYFFVLGPTSFFTRLGPSRNTVDKQTQWICLQEETDSLTKAKFQS